MASLKYFLLQIGIGVCKSRDQKFIGILSGSNSICKQRCSIGKFIIYYFMSKMPSFSLLGAIFEWLYIESIFCLGLLSKSLDFMNI